MFWLCVCLQGIAQKDYRSATTKGTAVAKKLKKMLKKLIVQKIQEENTTAFLSGMALGTDMFAAEIVMELKEKFREITLTAVLPCRT